MDQNIAKANEVKGATIVKNLKKRGMEAYYYPTAKEGLDKALELIPEGASVGWGGSLTIDQIGIKDILKKGNYQVVDRDQGKTPEERVELMKKALLCHTFLTSTNAITMDGELVNIDGNGNRLAAICFGPDQVIIMVGINKAAGDLSSAVSRVRVDACVPNAERFQIQTPCALTGTCTECLTGSTICSQILVTRYSKTPGRIQVIVIGEALGF